jgi:hypothetical protein
MVEKIVLDQQLDLGEYNYMDSAVVDQQTNPKDHSGDEIVE